MVPPRCCKSTYSAVPSFLRFAGLGSASSSSSSKFEGVSSEPCSRHCLYIHSLHLYPALICRAAWHLASTWMAQIKFYVLLLLLTAPSSLSSVDQLWNIWTTTTPFPSLPFCLFYPSLPFYSVLSWHCLLSLSFFHALLYCVNPTTPPPPLPHPLFHISHILITCNVTHDLTPGKMSSVFFHSSSRTFLASSCLPLIDGDEVLEPFGVKCRQRWMNATFQKCVVVGMRNKKWIKRGKSFSGVCPKHVKSKVCNDAFHCGSWNWVQI